MTEILVTMEKDGERLDVHPSCIADHTRMGWVVAPGAAPAVDHPTPVKQRAHKAHSPVKNQE